jgi:hypothetical protein
MFSTPESHELSLDRVTIVTSSIQLHEHDNCARIAIATLSTSHPLKTPPEYKAVFHRLERGQKKILQQISHLPCISAVLPFLAGTKLRLHGAGHIRSVVNSKLMATAFRYSQNGCDSSCGGPLGCSCLL